MQILIDLGNAPLWQDSRALGLVIRPMLQATTHLNQLVIRVNREEHRKSGGRVKLLPPLYQSGVRYKEEPRSWAQEHFDTIPSILHRLWGDCDDLAPWRVAELRESGQDPKAGILVKWKRLRNGNRLYHILVRRGDGSEEDPSRILGMGAATARAHTGL
jgi:hypothetical protein